VETVGTREKERCCEDDEKNFCAEGKLSSLFLLYSSGFTIYFVIFYSAPVREDENETVLSSGTTLHTAIEKRNMILSTCTREHRKRTRRCVSSVHDLMYIHSYMSFIYHYTRARKLRRGNTHARAHPQRGRFFRNYTYCYPLSRYCFI